MRSNFYKSMEIVALTQVPNCDSSACFHILTKKSTCSNINGVMHTHGFTPEHCLLPLPLLLLRLRTLRSQINQFVIRSAFFISLEGQGNVPYTPDHRHHAPIVCPRPSACRLCLSPADPALQSPCKFPDVRYCSFRFGL